MGAGGVDDIDSMAAGDVRRRADVWVSVTTFIVENYNGLQDL